LSAATIGDEVLIVPGSDCLGGARGDAMSSIAGSDLRHVTLPALRAPGDAGGAADSVSVHAPGEWGNSTGVIQTKPDMPGLGK
jgi:hypothetical protein